MQSWKTTTALLLLVLVAACQPQRKAEQSTPAQPPVVKRHLHADVYQLAAAQSSIRLKVYREGPLARFGHNHVIAIEQLSGTVYREKQLDQSEFELSFPVAAMVVDRGSDRAAAGAEFASAVTPEAIAGTRENMLGPKLLAAQQYPRVSLRSLAINGVWPDLQMLVAINLREFASQLTIPVRVSEQNGVLTVTGTTRLSQLQLGLTPYSVLGGGLRVSDAIDVEFNLVALRNTQQ